MVGARLRWLLVAGCAGLLLAGAGCMIAADAFNPAFAAGLGFDPGTIFPQSGTIIVTFTNETSGTVVFYAYESTDAVDLTINSRNFSVEVDSGETRNEVLDCPVGQLAPGSLDASFNRQTLAAEVVDESGATTIDYAGSPLIVGQDYECGDVIDIRVTSGLQLTVQVRPGG